MQTGLNLYIINAPENFIEQFCNEKVVLISNLENLEYINNDEILVFQNNALYLSQKIENQVIVLLDSKLQVTNEEFLIIDNTSKNKKSKQLFKNKEELFKYISLLNKVEFWQFIEVNKLQIQNTFILQQILKQNVDLNLIKIKLVSLWKF